ncbi:hypothetical protein I3842_08G084500 [Carya illinoinensis]|uniref:Uncharacterized protein n=1 Tax=Carya illinoinensis TaxID=32201 RepID=A0A922EAD1_CARIL|nr:hypothetical protein I3842_08G084500 [Carya illinoinensis]
MNNDWIENRLQIWNSSLLPQLQQISQTQMMMIFSLGRTRGWLNSLSNISSCSRASGAHLQIVTGLVLWVLVEVLTTGTAWKNQEIQKYHQG